MLADVYQLCPKSALLCWLFFSPPRPRPQEKSLHFVIHDALRTDAGYWLGIRGGKALHGPHFSKAFTQPPGQRKPTYWDKEELGELRRKKDQYQHLSTHSSPGKSHVLFFPLSGPRFWHQKSTGIVYLVLFVALLCCHWSLTFSTLFFEAVGGTPQHCISGHLVSEHAFNWQLSAWRLPHLSVSSSRSHSAPLSWCRARIPSSSKAVPRARTSFLVTLPLRARTHCHPTYWLVICLPVFSFRRAIQNLKPILNICIFPIQMFSSTDCLCLSDLAEKKAQGKDSNAKALFEWLQPRD